MKKSIKYIFRKIENFFLWSSGADLSILSKVPMEKNKFLGIGGTIIFTALMASFAGGYAFLTAFKRPELAFFFGIFWGALIYNLDRFIVSTFGSGDGKKTISRQEFFEASPRLLMAIILGIVISTPLEIKIFEKEIKVKVERLKINKKEDLVSSDSTFNNRLKQKKVELTAVNSKIELYTSQKSQLVKNGVSFLTERKGELEEDRRNQNAEVQRVSSIREKARVALNSARENPENQSLLSSRVANYRNADGNYQREVQKRNQIDQQILALQTNEQNELLTASNNINTQLSSLITQRDGLLKDIKEMESTSNMRDVNYASTAEDYDGFAAHLEALDEITSEKPILFYVKWLITILFIFIEVAPILFKMMTERGPYDDIVDRMKHEHKVRQLEIQSNINQEINTAVRLHTDKFEQKLNAELSSNKEILEAITKAQQEIAIVAIEKWKEEQKQKMRDGSSNIITSIN